MNAWVLVPDGDTGEPEPISSHGHPKITIIHRATIDKKSQKTIRKDLLQLNKEGATRE